MRTETPDREVRALARALGVERRQIVEALQAQALWPEGEPRRIQRLARPMPAARNQSLAQPKPKERPVRSETYRRLVAALPCAHCGVHGFSQFAHANEGKGMAMKTDDRLGFPLCCQRPDIEGCHAAFDQYRLLPGGRHGHAAAARSWGAQARAQITKAGLWPARLPQLTEDHHDE